MFRSKRRAFALFVVLAFSGAMIWAALTLQEPVSVAFSPNNVPTILAATETDAMYTLGYLHARDRFFQLDYQRHLFSGTLAELLGPAAIPNDVQLRTLGLRRAAERSLPLQTPEVMAWLEAYSDGVNAWLNEDVLGTPLDTTVDEGCDDNASAFSQDDEGSDVIEFESPLPPEYAALELDRDGIAEWTPLDSLIVAKGLAFGLSFSLDDIDRTIALLTSLQVGGILGFNGLQLVTFDLYPSAPFDPTVSIPPAAPPSGGAPPAAPPGGATGSMTAPYMEDPNLPWLLQTYRDAIVDIPFLNDALNKDDAEAGSNWFLASGDNTESGFPMMANDPHLALDTPATFYEAHIQVDDGINVSGVTFPGAPGVVLGCTDVICWGATVNALDVTDLYQEVLLALGPDPTQPTHSLFQGVPEPLQFIPQTFLFNAIGDTVNNTLFDAGVPPDQGGVTIIVPRRNNGPIVQVSVDPTSPTPITGISVQYTGSSGTRELEAFRQFTRAESPDDFKDALQFFDVGSQNWAYADIHGNIAYFTSAEMPLREDLQFLFFPDGLQPPYFIRDGTNTLKHEWVPLIAAQPGQAIDYEILPFDEMPQVVNPPSGIILNANNDPIGTTIDNVPWNEIRVGFNGLLYLSSNYAQGFRAGRIQQLFDDALSGGGKLSEQQFKDFQANNQLLDAEVFVPYILDALDNAGVSSNPGLQALASDPDIVEAVSRLAVWDFSTPTGIPEGFDPGDTQPPGLPTPDEIDASVSATIYGVWRGQLVQRVIDQTLNSLPIPLGSIAPGSAQSMTAVRRLLDRFNVSGGVGLSLINFFNEPDGVTSAERRDLILLRALRNGLDLLASDDFAAAFGNSTVQDDYRWGKLHRIVFDHPLGGPFNIPPTGGPGNLSADLAGFSRAGGFGAVDASAHSSRADGLNEFMFGSGPSRRVVATMTPEGPFVQEVIPGGESGVIGNPFQTDQLNLWLVNDYHLLPLTPAAVNGDTASCQILVPPSNAGPQHTGLQSELSTDGQYTDAEQLLNKTSDSAGTNDDVEAEASSTPDSPDQIRKGFRIRRR